ncbi:ribosome maturation factor RimM [Pedobacter montanisoli]|uniref:Ribosome maturation factor RimM n=1 Tax=Pedobacter montanisoli TaxID=2923277 RepID=A0ABS9ZSE8_9SPHI|nr:ribosome maturation factor RimM [Pedobacter montanisoli]MCJ0741521.1 ribosome maturation factor RimM [Pedobacter montanisoli]
MTLNEAFYIGYITKTKGLKGEAQIFFEFENYDELDLEVLFLEINSKLVPFFVDQHKLYPNNTGLFLFEGIDNIDKVKDLVKKRVYLPLNKMPARDEDEFYYTDLVNYMAVDESLGELGEIIAVNEYPQQFVATVVYQEKEVLFPLNEDFIVEIDEQEKILHLDLPEGLLDIYLQ